MSAVTRWTAAALGAVAAIAACSAEPVNLALGKSYTFSTTPTYRYCTDPGDSVQLTDGLHSTGSSALWLQKGTVGWNRVKSAEGAQMITVDLGESRPISGFAYTLAAGCADVAWPAAIGVYVSEDKKSWICAGDLWARSTSRTGAPKFDSYSVYRAFDDAMPCRGRYVAFLHFASGMGFCDEVEVFAGDEKTTNPSDARIVVNPFADKFRMQLHGFLASDAVRLGVAPPKMDVPDGMKADALRTELPLSAEHAALWAKNAPRLRAAGFASPVFWKSNRWGNLDPLAIPAKDSVADIPLEVEMMRGETRSETINILNPTDAPIDFTVTVEGLPESTHVDCREVLFTIGVGANGQWFGTASSALRPGRGTSVSFTVPVGASKQVWISFARPSGAAGAFKGVVRAVGSGFTLSRSITLKLHDIDFPERPRMHVGGWDYLDDGSRYCDKSEMNAAHKREMLAMYTDTAWGSKAVFPKNARFDKEGNLTNTLDFAALDGWVANWPEARMFAAFYCAMPGVRFFGEAAGTPRFNRMVGAYFRAFYEHARKISGGREIIVLTQDEPSSRKSSENAVLWNTPIRAAVPELKVFVDPVYEDAAKVPQDLVDATDILCPFRPYFSRKGQREAWNKMAGPGTARELHLYSCLVGSRGLDPEGYYRGQFWDAFRMGATGSFFWQFGCGAGSGSFAAFGQSHPECSPYFAGTTAADVMPGKQSEGVREGVEDHELLVLLREAADAIRAKGGDVREIDEFLASAVSRAVDEKETADERFVRTHSKFDSVRIEALRLLAKTRRRKDDVAIVLKPGVPLLFADDSVIEAQSNVVRIVHQGRPDAKELIGDLDVEPWERNERGFGHPHMCGSVYPKEDGTGYRMWYGGVHSLVLVADSEDGIKWTKPILNICDVGGSTSNNVVLNNRLAGPSVLRDPFEKNPARRYKIAGCHLYTPSDPRTGFYTMTSPDGLHWSEERQIVRGWWDTCTMSQNPITGEYLVYHKHEVEEGGYYRRTVFLTRSRDFVSWTEPVRVFSADAVDDAMWRDNPTQVTDVYLLSVIGHAGGFIGLPSIFRMEKYISNPDKTKGQSPQDGPLYLAFASSHNGIDWMRDAGRRPILPNNPRGVYNRSYPGCSSGGALLHVGDETWLYTYCVSGTHGSGYVDQIPGVPRNSIGRAVWRRWGFVSLETQVSGTGFWIARNKKQDPGLVRTKPLIFERPELSINAKGEKIKVSVIDRGGNVVSCATFSGDATRAPLVWDVPPPIGAYVRLQFDLFGAALYAVETLNK